MSENLKELVNSQGWREYCDLIEEVSTILLRELFNLDMGNPNSVAKVIEIVTRLNVLGSVTYLIERGQTSLEEQERVDVGFMTRMKSILKKLWRKE